MVRGAFHRVRRAAAWLALIGVAAALAGCQSPYQMHFEGDDFPPGQYAPSSREQTARNVFWGAMYIAGEMMGCDDDD